MVVDGIHLFILWSGPVPPEIMKRLMVRGVNVGSVLCFFGFRNGRF